MRITTLALLLFLLPVVAHAQTRFIRTVGTIAELVSAANNPLQLHTNIFVAGYYTPNDGGGGEFIVAPIGATSTNAGTVFKSLANSSRIYIRQYTGKPNPRWAGAKGDGSTDDTIAFQSMLNLNQGLFIPNGVYIISELDVPDNSVIEGQGFEATLKKKSGTVTYVLGSMNANTYQNITIRNLHINGNKANATAGGGIALAGRNIEINNVFIQDTPDAGINLGYRAGGGSYRILNSFFVSCSKVGNMYGAIAVTGGPDVKIVNNQIICEDGGQAYGIDFEPNPGTPAADASSVLITGNTIQGGTLQIDCSNVTGSPTNFIISQNIVDARGAFDTGQDNMCPMFHRNLHGFHETGNIVYSHESAGTPFTGYYGWGNSDGEITGNTFYVRDVPAINDRIIYFDDASPSWNISIALNRIIALSGTPEYGVYSTFGATTNLHIFKNTFVGITNPQFVDAANVQDWQTDLAFTNLWAQSFRATNAFTHQRHYIGTQTNGDMLIIGSQTDAPGGFGSDIGVQIRADGTNAMGYFVARNHDTNTSAGLTYTDVLQNQSGTGLRAMYWKTRKLNDWLAGQESSYWTLGVLSNGVAKDIITARPDFAIIEAPIIGPASYSLDGQTNSVKLLSGTGSPEGTLAANIGTIYVRLDGSTNTSIYIKQGDSGGVTGWGAK